MANELNVVSNAALLEQALRARERAYVPYSRFAVGAAVLTEGGQVFHGCNIENAAYPATVCAERAALFSAYAAGQRTIVALAVTADTSGPVSPCGTCRQVIHELAANATIILGNIAGAVRITTPQALLPDGFDAAELPE
jgi:cytidine deaminase